MIINADDPMMDGRTLQDVAFDFYSNSGIAVSVAGD